MHKLLAKEMAGICRQTGMSVGGKVILVHAATRDGKESSMLLLRLTKQLWVCGVFARSSRLMHVGGAESYFGLVGLLPSGSWYVSLPVGLPLPNAPQCTAVNT